MSSTEGSPRRAHSLPIPVSPASPSNTSRSPFRPPLLSLNPALDPSTVPAGTPRSPFAFARSLPSSPPVTPSPPPSSVPPPRKTHLNRVARATREFRDAWIVPE